MRKASSAPVTGLLHLPSQPPQNAPSRNLLSKRVWRDCTFPIYTKLLSSNGLTLHSLSAWQFRKQLGKLALTAGRNNTEKMRIMTTKLSEKFSTELTLLYQNAQYEGIVAAKVVLGQSCFCAVTDEDLDRTSRSYTVFKGYQQTRDCISNLENTRASNTDLGIGLQQRT